jgi:hypothetical protein
MFADGLRRPDTFKNALLFDQGNGVMKAALLLVLTPLLGLGSGGAVAQISPGDPAGNQTIPEKDLSRPAEGRHTE